MYIIKRKSKKGGFWDRETNKVVDTITTESQEVADEYSRNGYEVEFVKDSSKKKPKEKIDNPSDEGANITDGNE